MTAAVATAEPLTMDAHTLDLLGFDKVRELLAGYAASSLGADLARQIEPPGRSSR
jgi:DNA mismatch repair protein MutS2